jgi:hypothetical protein
MRSAAAPGRDANQGSYVGTGRPARLKLWLGTIATSSTWPCRLAQRDRGLAGPWAPPSRPSVKRFRPNWWSRIKTWTKPLQVMNRIAG